MSIVKAINELSGKEANTIENAIRNLEGGGGSGGDVAVAVLNTPDATHTYVSNMSYDEILDAINNDKVVVALMKYSMGSQLYSADTHTVWFDLGSLYVANAYGRKYVCTSGNTWEQESTE